MIRNYLALAIVILVLLVVMFAASGDEARILGAVKNGDAVSVYTLLVAGANVNQRDDKEKTPLIIAAENGDISLVKLLLSWDADINASDTWDRTPLLIAAQKADTAMLRVLLAAKANADAGNKNKITPLIASVQKNNLDGTKVLLDYGANTDTQDSIGRTALIWAVIKNNENIVKLLLENGANPNIIDRENMTALVIAEKANPRSEIFMALSSRVNVTATQPLDSEIKATTGTIDKTKLFNPAIDSGRLIIGNVNAPVTIVEYTDLQCPYCVSGARIIKEITAKYGDKIRVVIKHNPLAVHRQALIAAVYFEAVAKQDPSKALLFHDLVFKRQEELKNGEKFLKEIALETGIDLVRLEQDIIAKNTKDIIEQDLQEVGKFGFLGVPVFIVNGIPLYGVPANEEFYKVIDEIIGDK